MAVGPTQYSVILSDECALSAAFGAAHSESKDLLSNNRLLNSKFNIQKSQPLRTVILSEERALSAAFGAAHSESKDPLFYSLLFEPLFAESPPTPEIRMILLM
jgi:hypothetical protein